MVTSVAVRSLNPSWGGGKTRILNVLMVAKLVISRGMIMLRITGNGCRSKGTRYTTAGIVPRLRMLPFRLGELDTDPRQHQFKRW